MKNLVLKVGTPALLAAAIGIVLSVGAAAQARPQYNKAFAAKYPSLEAAKEAKCGVCHFGKGLGEANQKDEAKISAALTGAESEKNAAGQTFGELIKAGKLPGTPQ